ncbi:MAG: hypothetical protein GY792_05525, partial [Gammaproteobacteria bacterium]|nr:hypothetical protein [Gammaproteobacteria bacterium]
ALAHSELFQEAAAEDVIYRGLSPVVNYDVSPPLAQLTVPEHDFHAGVEILDDRAWGGDWPLGPQDTDPLVQAITGPEAIPTPIISFDGPSNLAGVSPPDPVGDVGPDHYVAMSN